MKKAKVVSILSLCLLLICTLTACRKAAEWKLSGVYMEPCMCDIPCPHVTTATEQMCKGFGHFHIVEGFYGDVVLDNLDVTVMSETPPGPPDEPDWIIATYISEEASPEQIKVVQKIVQELYGASVAEDLGIKSVPIDFQMSGDTYRLSIPDILEVESTLLPNMPSVPGYFGQPYLQAKATVQKYSDHGKKWDHSGQNSWHSKLLLPMEKSSDSEGAE
ncbi:DUF1326 domain-containing protein [Candidatus Poribacteria bacterium]